LRIPTERVDRGWKEAQWQGEDRVTIRITLITLMESKVIIPLPSTKIVKMLQSHVSTTPAQCYNICAYWWSLLRHVQWSKKPFNIDICCLVVMEDKELIIQSLAMPTINQFNCIFRQLCTNTIIDGLRSKLPECQAPCTPPLDKRG
jgi:hypothetical protein